MKKVFLLLCVTCALQGQIIDVNKYGWLDQYSLNDFLHGFIGDERTESEVLISRR